MQESQHTEEKRERERERTGHIEDTRSIQVEPWDFARAALPVLLLSSLFLYSSLSLSLSRSFCSLS